MLHLLGSGDTLPEHNGGHRSNEEENLGRHKNKKRESKPKYLSSMERHLAMTIFRIQITGLQANVTCVATHTLTYMGSIDIWWVQSPTKHIRMWLHTSHWNQGSFLYWKLEHMYRPNGTGMEAWKGCSVTPSTPRSRWAQTELHGSSPTWTGTAAALVGSEAAMVSKWKRQQEWSRLQNEFYWPGTKIFSVITEKDKYRKQSISWQVKPYLVIWHVVSCTGSHGT